MLVFAAPPATPYCNTNSACVARKRASLKKQFRPSKPPAMKLARRPSCNCTLANRSNTFANLNCALKLRAAVQAADDFQPDTKKLALYRAGVLAAELDDREKAEKHLTQLAAIDFGYRDVAERLDKLAELRDSV